MTDRSAIIRCLGIHKKFSLDRREKLRQATADSPAEKLKGELRSELHVLKGIDLEVSAGEIISIVGASGSGKSTLLHILGGLDRPSAGNVYWQDKELSTLDDDSLAELRGSQAGFVFQFHYLLPEFTALENVMIPMMILGKSVSESEARAQRLLQQVALADRLHHKPNELSGGEQQRVAIARALANEPRVIFADEPSGNLDSQNSQMLHDLFVELNGSLGQTFLIVTHNESFAERSHRRFKMSDGRLERL